MPNPDKSQSHWASIGYITSDHPIDAMWNHFVSFNRSTIDPEILVLLKFAFYSSAMLNYNAWCNAARSSEPAVLANFSERSSIDLNTYFRSK